QVITALGWVDETGPMDVDDRCAFDLVRHILLVQIHRWLNAGSLGCRRQIDALPGAVLRLQPRMAIGCREQGRRYGSSLIRKKLRARYVGDLCAGELGSQSLE